MAFVDNNSQQGQEQVAGATPLSTGADTTPMSGEQATTPSNTGSTGSTIQSQASGEQNDSQVNTTNKKAPKASSGMFTNIQKYVEKNKPQAQAMAGAVTQDVGKQAEQIRQAAAEKEAQQQQALQANQQAIDQNKQWATDQVTNVMTPVTTTPVVSDTTATQETTPTAYVPSEEDSTRFQDLMRGDIGVQQVGDLNIAEQQLKAQALSQLAGNAATEEGRRNLLGETFKKQADYSRGMSGLDQLITSGDANARQALVQGISQETSGLQQGLDSTATNARNQQMAQSLAIQNFGTDVQNLTNDQVALLNTQMQESLDAEVTGRAGLTDQYTEASQSADDYLQNMISRLSGTGYGSEVENLIKNVYSNASDEVGARTTNLEAYADALKSGQDLRFLDTYARSEDKGTMDNLQTGWSKNRNAISSLLNQLNQEFAGNELYDVGGLNDTVSSSGTDLYNRLASSQGDLASQYEGLGTGEDVISEAFQSTAGQSLEDYVAGEGIDQYDTAEQIDVDRYNALQQLIGGQDIIDESRRDSEFVKQDALQALLDKYKGV